MLLKTFSHIICQKSSSCLERKVHIMLLKNHVLYFIFLFFGRGELIIDNLKKNEIREKKFILS